MTWEPAAAIDGSLIANYENDMVATSITKCSRQYGSVSTTLITEFAKQDFKKKPKIEQHLANENKG